MEFYHIDFDGYDNPTMNWKDYGRTYSLMQNHTPISIDETPFDCTETRIRQLKKDIKHYEEMGIVWDLVDVGHSRKEWYSTNFNKVAERCKQKLEEINKLAYIPN